VSLTSAKTCSASPPPADKITMDSPSVSTIVSCVPKSDRNAKHSSLYFTEDAVVVKPWYLENTELVDMVKDLILMQTAWIVSREKAIEDLLRTKFENKIEIFLVSSLRCGVCRPPVPLHISVCHITFTTPCRVLISIFRMNLPAEIILIAKYCRGCRNVNCRRNGQTKRSFRRPWGLTPFRSEMPFRLHGRS